MTGFASRDLGAIALRGRKEPLHAYGVEGEMPGETKPSRSPEHN
jgi:hypothetical protein